MENPPNEQEPVVALDHFVPNAIPDDPWFYRFVNVWANISLAVAVAAAFACAIGVLVTVSLFANEHGESPWPWLYISLSSLAVGIACMTTSAFTHVLLDLARNIRRLRIHADHDAGIPV